MLRGHGLEVQLPSDFPGNRRTAGIPFRPNRIISRRFPVNPGSFPNHVLSVALQRYIQLVGTFVTKNRKSPGKKMVPRGDVTSVETHLAKH